MFKRAAIFSLLSTSGAAGFRQVARFSSAKPVLAALKEGDVIPNVVFKARVRDAKIGGDNPFAWKDVSTSDLFKGKRAVVFALPGGTNLLPMFYLFSLQLHTCIAVISCYMQ
jgi:hypothetical protein